MQRVSPPGRRWSRLALTPRLLRCAALLCHASRWVDDNTDLAGCALGLSTVCSRAFLLLYMLCS